jgi:hypothetical protein
MAKVTYRPIEQTDPNFIEWNGVRFDANVPVDLDPEKHFIMVPMPSYTMVNGIRQSIHHDTRVPMIEIAKGNKFFIVDDGPARGKPKTTEEDIFDAATEGLARPARGRRKAA